MRKSIFSVAALAVILAVAASATAAPRENGDSARGSAAPVTFAVYGDAPYGQLALDRTPAFVAKVNADPAVSLVMHVGDVHAGSDHCYKTNPNPAGISDQKIFDLWSQFSDPLVYTPGDNEWTDCSKPGAGGYVSAAKPGDGYYDATQPGHVAGDPLDNLAAIRSIFFAHPGLTLGQHPRLVLSQARIDPRYRNYVENVMWAQNDIVVVTLHLPGSNNDLLPWYGGYGSDPLHPRTPDPRQVAESAERTAADLAWLKGAFLLARLTHARGVLIGTQADMFDTTALPAPPAGLKDGLNGYDGLVKELAAEVKSFGKPVLLINGDSHVYGSDKPLSQAFYSNPATVGDVHGVGYAVDNLTRITVEGSTNAVADWYLRLTIDARTSQVFSWDPVRLTFP
jgi:hypothetical protein